MVDARIEVTVEHRAGAVAALEEVATALGMSSTKLEMGEPREGSEAWVSGYRAGLAAAVDVVDEVLEGLRR